MTAAGVLGPISISKRCTMPDIRTENYEKSVKKAIDRWVKKLEDPLQKIEKLNKEIDSLEAKKQAGTLTADEEELQKKCIATREKLQKVVEKAGLELKLDLMPLEPPPEAPKSDFEKLSDEIKKYIKKYENGLPLGGGFYLRPEIEFDFKKRTLKKAMVFLEWRF
jgi:hypothetical protein